MQVNLDRTKTVDRFISQRCIEYTMNREVIIEALCLFTDGSTGIRWRVNRYDGWSNDLLSIKPSIAYETNPGK